MPQKKNQSPQILQLFEGAEAAIAEIERNLGDPSKDLEKRLSEFSWRVRYQKEALLAGLLKVTESLGIIGPWKMPGRVSGWFRLDHRSGYPWIEYTAAQRPFATYSTLNANDFLDKQSRLYNPLCEVLMREIEKAMADLTPTTRRFKQLVRLLQKAAEVPRKPKS